MSELNTEGSDLKKFSEDFTKKIGEIASGVTNLSNGVANLNSKVDSQEKIIRDLKPQPKEEKEDEDLDDAFLLNDKKKIDQIIDARVEKKIEAKLSERNEQDKKVREYDDECKKWDNKAYDTVPQLNNQAFKDEVVNELQTNTPILGKKADGSNIYAPDAVYNAAHRIFSKWVREGKINPEDRMETIDRGGNGTRLIKGKEITEIQSDICQKFGIPENRSKEIYKSWNQSGAQKRWKRDRILTSKTA